MYPRIYATIAKLLTATTKKGAEDFFTLNDAELEAFDMLKSCLLNLPKFSLP
jgi:hypothetical protein